MEVLQSIMDFINNSLATQTLLIGGVVEVLLRVFKTKKPVGIAHTIVGFLRMSMTVALKVIEVLGSIVEFLDEIFPQRIKPEDE